MRHLPTLQVDNLAGGWNTASPATHIADNEFAGGQNVYLDELAKPTKCTGLTHEGASESNPITGMYRYDKSNGNDYQVYVTGKKLKYRTTGTGTTIYTNLTSGLRTRFAVMYGSLYICNGTDTPLKWDQNTITQVDMPKGKDCFEHEEKLFTYGMTDHTTSTDYPSYLRYSKIEDPDDWSDATNYINVGESDGTNLQKCVSDSGRIICWKDSSIWTITFDSIGDYDKRKILDIGTRAPDTVVKVGNDYLWLGDTAVYSLGQEMNYAGSERAGLGLSVKIKPEILKITPDYIHTSQAWFYDNKYFLAVPINGATKPNIIYIYDVILKVWLPPRVINIDMNIECFGEYVKDGEVKMFIGGSDGRLYATSHARSDAGNPIESNIKTKKYSLYERPNELELLGRIKTFYTVATFMESGTSDLTQKIYIDDEEKRDVVLAKTDSVNYSGTIGRRRVGDNRETIDGTNYYYAIGTGKSKDISYKTRAITSMNGRGYTIQFIYENNKLHSGFTLQGFAITNAVMANADFQSPSIKI